MSEDRHYTHSAPGVAHLSGEMVVLTVGDEEWVMRPKTAMDFYRHLGTVIGCLDGVDPETFTQHNREVWDVMYDG